MIQGQRVNQFRSLKMVLRLCAVALSATAFSPSLHAQDAELPQRWMAWTVLPFSSSHSPCEVDKSQAAQMVANLKKIVLAFVRSNPGYPSKGYVETRIGATDDGGCGPAAPLGGQVSVNVLVESNVILPAGGKGRATIVTKGRTEGGYGGFDLAINKLPAVLGDVDFASSSENNNPNGIGTYARPTSFFQGYPVLNHTRIVITPAGHPPLFIPVTLERALKLAIALHERRVADAVRAVKEDAEQYSANGDYVKSMKAAGVTGKQLQDLKEQSARIVAQQLQAARADFDVVQRKWNQLTTASRNAPAYVKQAESSAYIPQAEADDGADALVMPNPAYFDTHVARSVPQLLVISGFDDTLLDRPEPVSDWKAVQRVDWKAVAKELMQ